MAGWQWGTAVPSNKPTHALFDLYFAHSTFSLFKPITTMAAAGWELLAWQHCNAIPTPVACIVSGQQRCVDRKSLIRNVDSKNSADLHMQLDASADCIWPPVTSIILVFPLSVSFDHHHLISKYCMILWYPDMKRHDISYYRLACWATILTLLFS